MSYLWHGVFLNDFIKISYPVDVFLTIAALVYLGIGLCITILTYVGKKVKDSFKYGMLVGAIAGVLSTPSLFCLELAFIRKSI